MSTGGGDGDRLAGVHVDIEARMGPLVQDFAQAQQRTENLAQAMSSLKAKVKSGEITIAEYRTRIRDLAESHRESAAAMNAARESLDRSTASVTHASEATVRYAQRTGAMRGGFDRASGGASNLGYRLQQVGQTLDDLQYVGEMGLRPIINNLMQISSVVGIVAIAGYQLYTHWDDLMSLMGMGTVATEAEEMERLADATERTANEEERLERFKRRRQVEARQAEPSDEQKENERIYSDAVRNVDGGSDAVIDALVKSRNGAGLEGMMGVEDREMLSKARDAQVVNKDARVLDTRRGFASDLAGGALGLTDSLLGTKLGEKAGGPGRARSAHEVEREILEKYRAEAEAQARKDLANAAMDPERRKGILAELSRANPALADQLRDVPTAGEAKRNKEWQKQAEREQSKRDKTEREAAQEAERQRQEADQKASKLAGQFQEQFAGGFLDRMAAGKSTGVAKVDARDAIEKQLAESGQAEPGEKARSMANAVTDKMFEALRDEVRARANKEGLPVAEAAGAMAGERSEAERQKADRERQQARSEDQRATREAVDHAEAAMPALDERVRTGLMKGRAAGRSDDALAESLRKALEDVGLGHDEASRAAKGVVGEEGKKLNDDVAKVILEGPAKRAVPEARDAAGMLAAAQAKVGEDSGKAQVKLLERIANIEMERLRREQRPGRQRAVLGP